MKKYKSRFDEGYEISIRDEYRATWEDLIKFLKSYKVRFEKDSEFEYGVAILIIGGIGSQERASVKDMIKFLIAFEKYCKKMQYTYHIVNHDDFRIDVYWS